MRDSAPAHSMDANLSGAAGTGDASQTNTFFISGKVKLFLQAVGSLRIRLSILEIQPFWVVFNTHGHPEMEKCADAADVSVLFFLLGCANFLAVFVQIR